MRTFVQALRSPMATLERTEQRQREQAAAAPAQAPRSSAYQPPHRRQPPAAASPELRRTLRDLLRQHREIMLRGCRVLPYVDDFLLMFRSLSDALAGRSYVEAVLDLLGLARNTKKGVWDVPVQDIVHLGLGVDARSLEYYLPDARRLKIATAAREILGSSAGDNSLVSKRRLEGFCGLAQSVALAVPPVRHFLRELYDLQKGVDHRSGKLRLSPQARRDLLWFAKIPAKWERRPIMRLPHTAVVWTDASMSGWGGVVETDGERREAKGFWRAHERTLHINVLEMRAKWLVASSCPELVRSRHVRFMGDNQAVVAVSTSLTSRSPALMAETRTLFDILDTLDVTSTDEWLATHLNVEADRLSREADSGDWRLDPAEFRRLDRDWGPHSVDRFATENNAQLARFNSAWAQPTSEGVDAFAQTGWADERNWCNPPWALLPRLVRMLRETGAAATVLAPDWPAQAWYQQLAEMASDSRVLAPSASLFRPGRLGSARAVGEARWAAVAFRVDARR